MPTDTINVHLAPAIAGLLDRRQERIRVLSEDFRRARLTCVSILMSCTLRHTTLPWGRACSAQPELSCRDRK